jgi:adenylate cyclase class 2
LTVEAGLKARIRHLKHVHAQLEKRATGRAQVCLDAYYDTADHALSGSGRELRVRTVHSAEGTRSLLTFKDARVYDASGSKREQETRVEDARPVHALLKGLGYVPFVEFKKRCRSYDFEARGRRMLATLVQVPEINGQFIELETIVDGDQLHDALADVRAVLGELGIEDGDLTTEQYTDAVAALRND